MTIIERFEREYQQYHRISDERARQQRDLIAAFLATLDGGLTTARQSDLQAFAGAMLDQGLHVNTVRKKLNMLRPFFAWAWGAQLLSAEQYLSMKQVKNPRGASGKTLPRPYTKRELDAFWVALEEALPLLPAKGDGSHAIRRWLQGKGPWRRVARHAMRLQIEAMVALALHGGLRRAEIFNLSLDDLHYDNEYIVVRGKADPNTGLAKVRQVPFTEAMRKAMYTWLEFRALMRPGHDHPWLSCYSHWATNPMNEKRFGELLSHVVGEGWGWHRFRHTCATTWLRAGAELETVSRLLGHATLQQTLGYAEILKSDIARQLSKAEPEFERWIGRAA